MSKQDDRIAELDRLMEENRAMIRLAREDNARLVREWRKLVSQRHARRCRGRKWLWVTANFSPWDGPRYGDKVHVTEHRRKYVYVEWRGQHYSLRYHQVGLEKPNDVKINRHVSGLLADVLR